MDKTLLQSVPEESTPLLRQLENMESSPQISPKRWNAARDSNLSSVSSVSGEKSH